MLGLFRRRPKLAIALTPTRAVARELKREVSVAGELVVRNLGRDTELRDLELVLVAGGTRRIDARPGRGDPAQHHGRRQAPAARALAEVSARQRVTADLSRSGASASAARSSSGPSSAR